MLYYGDTKPEREEESKVSTTNGAASESNNELCRVRNLLNHCLMGLITIQHNGNMIIKLHETHDVATVGIIFAIYNLFQKICVVKPHASSFLSSR